MYLSGNDAIICLVSADIPCKSLPAAMNASGYLKSTLCYLQSTLTKVEVSKGDWELKDSMSLFFLS